MRPGVHGRDPDRPAEQVLAQPVHEPAEPELRRHVRGRVLIRLAPCHRAREEDVPAVTDVRQAEPRDAERAVDVRVQHRRLVLLGGLVERIAAECEPCVVVEDVDALELGDSPPDERGARLLVPHVEREGDVGVDTLDATRATDDPDARLAQLPHGRCADAARGAGDDRGLPGELHAREPKGHRTSRAGVRLQPDPGVGLRAAAKPRDGIWLKPDPSGYESSTESIVTGSTGRSRLSRSTVEMRSTTSCPAVTRPKTVCLPSRCGRRLGGDDEELRAVRVRPRVRHRERAADDLVLVELVLELVAGASRAGPERAPALDHEVRDHAVEREPVVEAVGRELREILDRLRSLAGVELELDRALARVQDGARHGREGITVQTTERKARPNTSRSGVRGGEDHRVSGASSRASSRSSGAA